MQSGISGFGYSPQHRSVDYTYLFVWALVALVCVGTRGHSDAEALAACRACLLDARSCNEFYKF